MTDNKIGFHAAVPGSLNGWGDYVRASKKTPLNPAKSTGCCAIVNDFVMLFRVATLTQSLNVINAVATTF